jgi:Peptidase family M28
MSTAMRSFDRPWRRVAASAFAAVTFAVGNSAVSAAPTLTETYQAPADKLIAAALADDDAYTHLAYLCDRIGHRISGSEPLARAITWSAELMRRSGLANVTLQPVTVPRWVRGAESGAIVSPVAKPLRLLGLGMSVGTRAGGLDAEVVVVGSLDELKQLDRRRVEGRIVVFNTPYEGYGKTVGVRVRGASQAAALGAVGVLVRSVTPLAMQAPHTGTLVYDEAQPKIPAAAVSPEDATLLARLAAGGAPVRVQMSMQAHLEPPVQSANVIGEIVGSTKPEEVVVLGGHIDSWDVGQGAHDDGAALMATLQAVRIIKQLGLKPRRTIRVVFWVNEENGGAGSAAYRKAQGERIDNHVAAIEMDGGAEAPVGYGYGASKAGEPVLPAEQRSFEMLREISALLKPVGADKIEPGGYGSDIEPLMRDGVPGLGETTTMAHYFDWHHTEADTFDKIDKADLRKNIASLAVMAYVLADMPERLAGHKAADKAP